MGSLYSLSLLALLLVTFVDQICGSEVKNTNHWFVERNKTPERLYEEELESILRSVFKNGIPGLGIPTLDPLVYNDTISVSEPDGPGIMTIEYLELGDFEVVGLSTFVTNLLSFNVLQLKISLNLTFPIQVKAKHSNFTIIVGDLLPFKGEGPANLIADLRVEADISLRTSPPPDQFVFLSGLSGDIFFDKLEVEFSTLKVVTSRKPTHIFNKFMAHVTPDLIDLMLPYITDGIFESLLITANEFLDSAKIELRDILSCLQGKPECPFGLS